MLCVKSAESGRAAPKSIRTHSEQTRESEKEFSRALIRCKHEKPLFGVKDYGPNSQNCFIIYMRKKLHGAKQITTTENGYGNGMDQRKGAKKVEEKQALHPANSMSFGINCRVFKMNWAILEIWEREKMA